MDEPDPRTPTPNDQHLDDLLWLWSLARRPLAAVLADLESWPRAYLPRACA